MNRNGCPKESTLVQRVQESSLDGELQQHIEDCAACRQVVQVVQAMAPLAAAAPAPPAYITTVWRARAEAVLRESGARRKQAAQPLRVFHAASAIMLLTAALAVGIVPILQPNLLTGAGSVWLVLAASLAAAGSHQFAKLAP